MTRYLLDTHVLLWWFSDAAKLSAKYRNLIGDPQYQIVVSTVSVWEIIVKQTLGKLRAPDNLKAALDDSEFEILAVDLDHVLYVKQLPLIHNDPFDRLLIAQALCEDLTIMTVDKAITKYQVNCL